MNNINVKQSQEQPSRYHPTTLDVTNRTNNMHSTSSRASSKKSECVCSVCGDLRLVRAPRVGFSPALLTGQAAGGLSLLRRK